MRKKSKLTMDSRDSNVQQSHATLCKNGCGFYSNAGNEGLCSVCYKDIVKKKQAPPTSMPASFSESQLSVNVISPQVYFLLQAPHLPVRVVWPA